MLHVSCYTPSSGAVLKPQDPRPQTESQIRQLKNIYHHPETKKENLQRETLAPSTATVDVEMLEKLAKPYLP